MNNIQYQHQFNKILELALKNKSLPKFKYENGVFIIQRMSNEKWEKYKLKKKIEWEKKYKSLKLKDLEKSDPCTDYLYVEIAYDAPHYKIMMFFYDNKIDLIFSNIFKYIYKDKI